MTSDAVMRARRQVNALIITCSCDIFLFIHSCVVNIIVTSKIALAHKAAALILFIFLLPGCAIVGSERYFATVTNDGKPEWNGDPRILRMTGKPDSIRYTKDGIDLKVFSPHLANQKYTFGPCIPIPLPIIPLFGLDHFAPNGPVQISFSVLQSDRQYRLTKATVLTDNQTISPKEIIVHHLNPAAGNGSGSEALLPLSLAAANTYVLTYDILKSSAPAYELLFFIQDESGTKFFKGKILFTQDKAITFTCVP